MTTTPSFFDRLRTRSAENRKFRRQSSDIAKALRNAPTQASRDEIRTFQMR